MRIADAQLYRYHLPLTEPVVLGGRRHIARTGLLLRLVNEDGVDGWGEAAPLPGFSGETLEQARLHLLRCAARLTGYRLPRHYDDLEGSGLVHTRVPSVSFALETAYYNLTAHARNVTPAVCINFDAPASVQRNGLLLGEEHAIVAKAARLAQENYPAVKLKVGARNVEADAALVHAVRDAIGPAVSLRLDANRAWTLDTAVQFARLVADCGAEYIEEPLRDPGALPDFLRMTGMPYALDETVQGWKHRDEPHAGGPAAHLARSACARALNRVYQHAAACIWKPTLMHVPNLRAAIAWKMFFPVHKLVLSAAFESGVGTAALASYAAAYAGAGTPAGLDTYSWLGGDVLAEPLPLHGPELDVPALAAAARKVDITRLERLTGP